IADVTIARNKRDVRAAGYGGVLCAHEHFALVFELLASNPMTFVVLAHREEHPNRLQPIRIGLLQMIEIFLARQAGALGILFENAHRCIVLIVAETSLHLRAQRADQPNEIVGAAPWRQIFRIDITRCFERIGRAPRYVIDGLFGIFFSAGLVAPLKTPAVRSATAEADDADDAGLL